MTQIKRIKISVEYIKALKKLTPRQIEVLEEVAKGRTNREIGEELNLSHHTIKSYRETMCKKLDLEGYRGLFYWCDMHMSLNLAP